MTATHSSSLLKRAVALLILAIPALAALGVVGPASPARAATDGKGYWEVASDGGIFSFGDAKFQGSMGGTPLNQPIVGMAAHPSGDGYWFVAADGGIFSFGASKFHGSMGGSPLNRPIVGMAAHPSGDGYWLVADDGGIFSFGASKFHGSMGGSALNEPIVGMAAHPSGNGYWFVASDGGIFSFGDAKFHGSMGGSALNEPIVGMAAHPSGNGYWFVARDGGIFSFGAAKFFGSMGGSALNEAIVGMAAHPSGNGYWFVASDGGIFSFGDAKFHGSMGGSPLNRPIVGMAATPDSTKPTATVNQAAGQEDPTDESTIEFTVTFSEPVSGFTASDVTIGGTAGGSKTATVTGGPNTYTVSVAGMTTDGTVTVSIPANAAVDSSGNGNAVATSSDNSVTYDNTDPGATVTKAAGQDDPTNEAPINFTVVFSEPVTGFTANDVALNASTTPGTEAATVTGSGATYNVAVSGMTGNGDVTVTVPAGAASDTAGNPNAVSTVPTGGDNTVAYDTGAPSATVSTADGQENPTDEETIDFKVVFNEAVTGFTTGDVVPGGTAPGTKTATISGEGTTYNVAVTGVTGEGTVTVTVDAAKANDLAGNANVASNEHTINVDRSAPTVTVAKAATQENPTDESVVDFTVTFNEPVVDFDDASDVSAAGTAPGSRNVVITNSGDDKNFNVAVSGMTSDGTVTLTVPAAVAKNRAGLDNTASATPASVTYDDTSPTPTVAVADGQDSPTNDEVIDFTVVFDDNVTGFGDNPNDVTVSGDPGGTATVDDAGDNDEKTYTVSVSGMTESGTVTVTVPAGAAQDAAGNSSNASPGSASVAYDNEAPTFDSISATGESTSVIATFSQPVLCTTVQSTDFTATVGGSPVAVSAAACTGTNDAIELTLASAPVGGATVSVRYGGSITDEAGNEAPKPTTRTTTAASSLGVTVIKAASQENPTDGKTNPGDTPTINFTVQFTAPVTGFTDEDVEVGGTTTFGTKAADVGTSTDGGRTYNVAVTGMNDNQVGTVTVRIPAGKATDSAGNFNNASNTASVDYDEVEPTVTVTVPSSQENPTNESPVKFSITTSEETDLAVGDLVATDGGSPTTVTLTETTPTTYTASVTATSSTGSVVLTVPIGAADDPAGNDNVSAASATVTRDTNGPTATITKADSQPDPTNEASIEFKVEFNEEAFNVTAGDFTAVDGDNVGLSESVVKNSATVYTVSVTGMTADGPVVLTLAANTVEDKAGNGNPSAATGSVTYETDRPGVTVTAVGDDRTNDPTIVFNIQFDEAVSEFVAGDVTVDAPGNETTSFTATDADTYTMQVSGMGEGPVTVSVASGVAKDAANNTNTASAPETVVYDTSGPVATVAGKAGQANPTNTGPVLFTVAFNEAVNGFTNADLTSQPAGTTATITDAGDGKSTYTVSVAGLAPNSIANVTLTLAANSVSDAAGNTNPAAATGSVAYDNVVPTFNSITAAAAETTVVATFSEPLKCSTVDANGSDFLVSVNGVAGGVTAAVCTGASDATIDLTIDPAPGANESVTVALNANAVTDPAGNAAPAQQRSTTATPVTVTVARAPTQKAESNQNSFEFVATFSEPVTGLTPGGLTVTAPGSEAVAVTPSSGFHQTYTITVSNVTADGTVSVSVKANAASDEDGVFNEASPAPATALRDTVAPTFDDIDATVNSANIVLNFSGPIDCNSVASGDFTVEVNTTAATISSDSCASNTTATTFNLTLTSPVPVGTVEVDLIGTVTDLAGNAVPAVTRTTTTSAPST